MTRSNGLSRALAAQLFGSPALPATPADHGVSLTDQAARWADHTLATSPLPPAYVVRKALDAVAFSLRHGLRDFAVPSKLVGVAAHQHAVEALALYDQLPIADRPRLVVSHGLQVYAIRSDRSLHPVGQIQPKHAAWIAPLLGHGAAVHLQTVTGLNSDGSRQPVMRGVTRRTTESVYKTLGVNIRVSGLAFAIDSLALVQKRQQEHVHLTLVAEAATPYRADRGEARPPEAVRLWRDPDGRAVATCPSCGASHSYYRQPATPRRCSPCVRAGRPAFLRSAHSTTGHVIWPGGAERGIYGGTAGSLP
jgi:hypothetical protein